MTYTKLKPYTIYPLLMLFAYILHIVVVQFKLPLLVATYLPVFLSAIFIHIAESRMPYRNLWLPKRDDLLQDSMFMLIVQMLLPKFLSFFVALYLLTWTNSDTLIIESYWPHHWSIIWQVLFLMIIADFLRYWLHRAFHEISWLWPFHAVHHSPHKLYWLNVGRFHPIDKAMQYLFDVLPFILLGVSEQVLALYFVFYAINGFFQHCNIRLSLGFLNYLISGPELHRWHHSIIAKESNKNYGNNLIIWDCIFGTRFLPKDKSVDQLGLINREYPLSFIQQLKSPFIKKFDKYNGK